MTRWPVHRRAGLIGRVLQNPFSGTAPNMTIAENLALAARHGRLGVGPEAQADIHDRIRQFNIGLEDRLDNAIGTFSGGQRQALTLPMATWLKPELLLLDEHTAALDPKSADKIIAMSEQIIARDNLTTRSSYLRARSAMSCSVGLPTPTVCSMRSLTFRMTDAGSGRQQATEQALLDGTDQSEPRICRAAPCRSSCGRSLRRPVPGGTLRSSNGHRTRR
jgi:hypothetical protein